jgi:acyl-CoA synthetase (AMP-forming)/AMP-acid ligase II
MVPAMYKLCLRVEDLESYDLLAWRLAAYGGAMMSASSLLELRRRLPRLELSNGYGATETTSPAAIMPPSLTDRHPDAGGMCLPCAEILIVDESGNEVKQREPGEIWIRGPMVSPGYWNNPAATTQDFVDGYWRSGDLGSIDENGLLRILDRLKDSVNRGGYKVYSSEVENILLQHPGVDEAVVIGKPDTVLGERVHAVVSRRDSLATEESLQEFCARRLADYKVPESFTLLDTPLPRNANGKILKRSLRENLFERVGESPGAFAGFVLWQALSQPNSKG